MADPSCTIVVCFYKETNPKFTYLCVNHPPAWFVSSTGDICPTPKSRLIELDLHSHPHGAKFVGIKLSTTPGGVHNSDPDFNDTSIIVTKTEEKIILDDDTQPAHYRVWYALGIKLGSEEFWDDPKIYNPPEG